MILRKSIFSVSYELHSCLNSIMCRLQVLDIAGPALQPKECVNLALRKPTLRRKSTQTWRFDHDGRLYCAHKNMCVQARDGFFGLRIGEYFAISLDRVSVVRRS